MNNRNGFTLINILIGIFFIVMVYFITFPVSEIKTKNHAIDITTKIVAGHTINNKDVVFYLANQDLFQFKTGANILADIAEFDVIPPQRIEIHCFGVAKSDPFAEVFYVATQADFEQNIKTRKLVIHQGWTSNGIPFKNLLIENYSYCRLSYVDLTTTPQ